MEKGSFVFRKEWRDAISGLPGEVRLEVYEAIIEYGTSGTLPTGLKPMTMLAFNFARTTLDRDAERYDKISAQRKKAADKRWKEASADAAAVKKTTGSDMHLHAKNANACKCMQTHTSPPCDGDGDSDSDSEYSYEYKKKPPEGGKKDAAEAATPLEGRKKIFYSSLIPYVDRYGKDMVRDFFNYWTEPNKTNTKMRFEMERTWEVSRRLSKWAARDRQFNADRNETRHEKEPATPLMDKIRAEQQRQEEEMQERRSKVVSWEEYCMKQYGEVRPHALSKIK